MKRYKRICMHVGFWAIVIGLVWSAVWVWRQDRSPVPQAPVVDQAPEPAPLIANEAPVQPDREPTFDKPVGVIRGQVLDFKGQPVAGANLSATRVCINTPEAESITKTSLSDEDGLFAFDGLRVFTGLPNAGQRSYWRIEAGVAGQLGVETVEPALDHREWFIYIVLKSDTAISGIVTGDKQAPTPAAAIHVSGHGRALLERDATTDGAGKFQIDRLFPDRYLISAVAAGFAPAELEVTTLSRDPVSLKLHRGSSLTGRVVNAQGEGVPNLVLKSVRESSSASFDRVTTSDASGAFQFAGLRPGPHRILLDTATNTSVLASAPGVLDVPEKHSLDGVKLLVESAATIVGTVVDRATGAGVPYVRVRAESQNAYPANASAVTDKGGAFRIAGLGAGSYVIEPVHAGATGYLLAVTTRYGETSNDVKLELNLKRSITGVVRDAQGKPAANASVIVRSAKKSLAFTPGKVNDAQTVTDETGAFTLYPPRDMDTVYLQAAAAHSLSQCMGPLPIPPVGVSSQALTLVDTAEVEGIVVDGSGRALTNRIVVAQIQGDAPMNLYALPGATKHKTYVNAARTAPGGHFRFAVPAPGTYSLAVEDAGKLSRAQDFDLKPGALAGGIILSVEDPPGTLAGTVTLAGKPVENAQVSVGSSAQTETDSAGQFHLEDLEPGDSSVTVTWRPEDSQNAPSYSHTEQVTIVSAETTQVAIELGAETGVIEGRVTDGGAPAEGVRVSIQGERFASGAVTTSEDGAFRFANVPVGAHLIVAQGTDGDSQSENATVTRGQTTTVTLDFATGILEGTITGLQPTDEGELILLSGNVNVTEVTLEEGEQMSEDAVGRAEIGTGNTSFRLEHIKPGSYTLLWAIAPQSVRDLDTPPPTIPVNTHRVEITANEPTRVTLRR